ncbi:ASKHA domain-containing protein [Desulfolucanica intricata]|uniref:ASKHA domain-containing protein n=1 Tax=Desulfolucanica intricata TaxID=1285191 RepID=UPI00083084C4|nr:ASKHA domain-containing protein [Desulfolucanica intricata]
MTGSTNQKKAVILEGRVIDQNFSLDPITKKIFLNILPPSMYNNQADVDRLREELIKQFGPVRVPLELMQAIPAICRKAEWQVTATIGYNGNDWELINLEPGNNTDRHYGLAIDIGTTTVVVYLVDMLTGDIINSASDYNGQVVLGDDILTRIFLATYENKLPELQKAVVNTINHLIEELSERAHVNPTEISAVTVGANTTMLHLLLGLDPGRICREPYIPVVNNSGFIRADKIGLNVNELAMLYAFPSVGSYVGGDVIAGVLVSGMHLDSDVSLFVDIGTNGEIIIGNRDWLVACAGAAGPALEGGVVKCGMRAEPGAVERLSINPETYEVSYKTIGNEKPVGICGSGLIDCLAEFLLTGIINRQGRFQDGRKEFVLIPAAETGINQDIVITQVDIDNLMRTKGAVNAAVETLLEGVGCGLDSVSKFFTAGAFGQYLPIESSITIGLYPDLPREKIKLLGNSSGEGARLALLSNKKRLEAEEIAARITYFELNANDSFFSRFVGSRFLPHTNLDYYPTVKAKLIERGLLS